MTFEGLVIAILHEQDCKTHYFQEGEERLVRLHQKYRAEAIEQLRNWIAAQVAAERERCALRVEKCAQYCQDIADDEGMLLYPQVVAGNQYAATVLGEAAAAIRARAGEGEQVPMSDNPNCET